MTIGPGRYNDACVLVRNLTRAKGVLLIVIEGEHGEGFEVQAPLDVIMNLPRLLREIAAKIEADGPLAP